MQLMTLLSLAFWGPGPKGPVPGIQLAPRDPGPPLKLMGGYPLNLMFLEQLENSPFFHWIGFQKLKNVIFVSDFKQIGSREAERVADPDENCSLRRSRPCS